MRRSPRRRSGFTLIEVMMSVAIITIGATGLFAMQGATVRANADAAESTVATAFASTWIERLKRDALYWTARGNAALTVPNVQYIRHTADCTANTWFVPTPVSPNSTAVESPAADLQGFDVDLSAPAANRGRPFYCANAIVSPVHGMGADSTMPIVVATDADLLRVTVRVWWARTGRGGATMSDMRLSPASTGVCTVPTDDQLAEPTIRTTYLSTLVHWNRYR